MYVFISQQKKKDKTKQNKTKNKKRPKNMRDRGIERQKDITS